jgi:hypothetical protein
MKALKGMFFFGQVGWWNLELLAICLLMTTGGIVMFRFVRDKGRRIRIPVRFFAVIFAVSGMLSLLLFLFFSDFPNPNTYSSPIYSPIRKMAARIRDYNLSGFGGADSSVELFAAHGFRSKMVYFGEFKSIDDVRWLDDQRLKVRYHTYPEDRQPTCVSLVFGVDIVCQRSEIRQFLGAAEP